MFDMTEKGEWMDGSPNWDRQTAQRTADLCRVLKVNFG